MCSTTWGERARRSRSGQTVALSARVAANTAALPASPLTLRARPRKNAAAAGADTVPRSVTPAPAAAQRPPTTTRARVTVPPRTARVTRTGPESQGERQSSPPSSE